jgi:hypothetical protein
MGGEGEWRGGEERGGERTGGSLFHIHWGGPLGAVA